MKKHTWRAYRQTIDRLQEEKKALESRVAELEGAIRGFVIEVENEKPKFGFPYGPIVNAYLRMEALTGKDGP